MKTQTGLSAFNRFKWKCRYLITTVCRFSQLEWRRAIMFFHDILYGNPGRIVDQHAAPVARGFLECGCQIHRGADCRKVTHGRASETTQSHRACRDTNSEIESSDPRCTLRPTAFAGC